MNFFNVLYTVHTDIIIFRPSTKQYFIFQRFDNQTKPYCNELHQLWLHQLWKVLYINRYGLGFFKMRSRCLETNFLSLIIESRWKKNCYSILIFNEVYIHLHSIFHVCTSFLSLYVGLGNGFVTLLQIYHCF